MLATPEEGKESGQPPDEMTHHWGHCERQWRVSFLWTTVYFSKVWASPVAAAGRDLALDQTRDMQFSSQFVGASQILIWLPPASSLLIWKGFSKLTQFLFFFLLENKKHLPTHHRLHLLVSQRPCKLLVQTFTVTPRWKELHLAHSTACCLNSSTQFILCSYKIIMCF